MSKYAKTFVLLAGLSGLMLWVGELIGGGGGLMTALVLALLMNGAAYFFSDKLAIKMAGARPIEEHEEPQLYAIVRSLAQRAGQPMPRLYVSPSPQLNAFATGRNPDHAAVCVNQGLLQALDRDEIEGVLAHELQHVYNRDILIGSVAATIATAITFLARMAMWSTLLGGGRDDDEGAAGGIFMLFLAPIAAFIIQAAISRSRESSADLTGAELCGKPLALASALRKIDQASHSPALWRRGASRAETNPAFAHMYIEAPFGGRGFIKLFSTHPQTAERVEALERLARRMGQLGPEPRLH